MFHNQIMDYVDSQEGLDGSLTNTQAYTAIANWIINHSTSDTVVSSHQSAIIEALTFAATKTDSLLNLGATATKNFLGASADVNKYIDSLFVVGNSINSNSYATTSSRIAALKTTARNDGSLDDPEMAQVMAGISTLQKSFEYWWSFYDVDNKTGPELAEALTNAERVAKADALGAIGGAVGGFFGGLWGGAIIGSIGGPAGTLGGALGGAVVGSLVGGVTAGASASVIAFIIANS